MTSRMTTTRRDFLSLLVVMLSLTLLSVGCGRAVDSDASDGTAFWGPLRVQGDEVEGYSSLSEMADEADAVVRGRFAGYGPSRTLGTDTPEDTVTYAAAEVEVVEVLRGEVPADALPVEFLVSAPADQVDALIEEQQRALPEGEVVLFLREKRGEGESGLYRVVNSNGLWTTIEGQLAVPMAEGPEAAAEGEGEESAGAALLRGAELTPSSSLAQLVAAVEE